ncbi:g-type lectin s-receptor-like serine/threonine-protein kinase [Fagus crenata]
MLYVVLLAYAMRLAMIYHVGVCRVSNPFSNDAWSKGNMSSGCVRETALNCINSTNVQKDEFLHMSKVDWPHNLLYLEDIGNDKECQSACLNNCSCVAYDQKYDCKVDGNKLIRCLVWDGSLLNLKQLSADDLYGNDFYLKLANPSRKLMVRNGNAWQGLE